MSTIQVDGCKVSYQILPEKKGILMTGRILEYVKDEVISFIAATPAYHGSSFSGSGLPYATPAQAFDRTPNQGIVHLTMDRQFEFIVQLPNSYYSGLGTVIVPPTVYITYNNGYIDKLVSVKISQGIPYRMLSYPNIRKDVSFYDNQDLPVRTQEQILIDSAYPPTNRMWDNHWGLRPPM
jgi:hypothetical protein